MGFITIFNELFGSNRSNSKFVSGNFVYIVLSDRYSSQRLCVSFSLCRQGRFEFIIEIIRSFRYYGAKKRRAVYFHKSRLQVLTMFLQRVLWFYG